MMMNDINSQINITADDNDKIVVLKKSGLDQIMNTITQLGVFTIDKADDNQIKKITYTLCQGAIDIVFEE